MYIKKKESLSESENSLDLNNLILKEEELNSGNRSNKCINYKETNYKEENERKKFIKLERRNISLEKEKYISYDSENTNNNKDANYFLEILTIKIK
jgi:hypothetical protein